MIFKAERFAHQPRRDILYQARNPPGSGEADCSHFYYLTREFSTAFIKALLVVVAPEIASTLGV